MKTQEPLDHDAMPVCETTGTRRLPETRCIDYLPDGMERHPSDITCGTYAGNLGPCECYEMGANGRCVYCDHALACHPQESQPVFPPLLRYVFLERVRPWLAAVNAWLRTDTRWGWGKALLFAGGIFLATLIVSYAILAIFRI